MKNNTDDQQRQEDLLTAALEYADLGYRVHPLKPGDKTPLLKGWPEKASTNPEQVNAWWQKWPNANIGISCHDLLIVDIDGKNNEWLVKIGDLASDLMKCPIVETPSQGTHRWFRQPSNGRAYSNTASSLGKNVDTRASGGYVVAPPSRLANGGTYRWLPDFELTKDLNEPAKWLLDQLGSTGKTKKQWLDDAGEAKPSLEGERDVRLISEAGALRRRGWSRKAISASLHVFNEEYCDPPLSREHVEKKVDSAMGMEADPITVAIAGGHYKQAAEEARKAEIMPDWLLHPPGLLGDIIEYNLASALVPQPIYALAGALAMLGAITGRKVCDALDTRTNIYILCLGRTGSGKEHARKVNKRLMFECGGMQHLSKEAAASYQGVLSEVKGKLSVVFQWDEMGRYLKAITNPTANAAQAGIITMLIKLYSSADTTFSGDAYADSTKNYDILQPNACLYGTSTQETFFDALTSESIGDGFLNRLLVFEIPNELPDPIDQDDLQFEIPPELAEKVRRWIQIEPGGGNMCWQNPTPTVYQDTPETKKFWKSMQLEVIEIRRNKKSKFNDLWARTYETARKIALLYACSVEDDVIGIEAAKYGRAMSEYLTRSMVRHAFNRISDNPFDNLVMKARQWMKEVSDVERTRSNLYMKLRVKPRELMEVIETLVNMGCIVIEPRTGRIPESYKLLRKIFE